MRLPRGFREAALALTVAALTAAGFVAFGQSPQVRSLETATLDLRFRLRGTLAPGPEVAVILADDRSLAALGRWPFSRRLMARAVGALEAAGARVVAFDLLFAEAEETVPPALREALRQASVAAPDGVPAALAPVLRELAEADSDTVLATAIGASGRVLLPLAFGFAGSASPSSVDLAEAGFQRFEPSLVEPEFPLRPVSAVPPVAVLATAALGLGHVAVAYDRDGSPRYDYLALPFEADFIPSLPLRAVAAYLGIDWPAVGLALGQGVMLGGGMVPTDHAHRILINYRGPRGTFPTYSFADLVEERVPAEALRGRLVFVGASFIGNADSSPAPFGQTPMPGTERLANVADMLLRRDFLVAEPALWSAIGLGAVLAAAMCGAIAAWMPTRAMLLTGLVPVAAWGVAAQMAFTRGHWLPAVQPVTTVAMAVLAVLLYRYWLVDRDGRHIRHAFQHYMAPAQVELLAAHPERLRLGGETRQMTMLFCDIRGFTTISEQFKADPQGLTKLINAFLTPMTDIIMARRGTIDKYMGDCIMAFWNAPLDDPGHAEHACESALAMLRELEALNGRLAEQATREGRPFHRLGIGIGLNSGDCVVGNMGSERRFDYSVLGDAVNLASRLEGQSKTYGVGVVIGETTRALAPGWAAVELDRIAVKGKKEAVTIYTLMGDPAVALAPSFAELTARHTSMLERYRAQDWAGAREALAVCRSLDTPLSQLYDLYEERITYYERFPPGPGWDGVFVATSK